MNERSNTAASSSPSKPVLHAVTQSKAKTQTGATAFLLTLNKHNGRINTLEIDNDEQDTKIARLTAENKLIREEMDALKRAVAVQHKAQTSIDGQLGMLEEGQDAMRERDDSGSDDGSESEDGDDMAPEITVCERKAMEESSAAYSDTSLKACKVQKKCMVLTCIIVNESGAYMFCVWNTIEPHKALAQKSPMLP
jgi:hypothetical protein